MRISPLTKRRFANFRANRRGWWSLWIFLALFLLTLGAELVANERPLIASYQNELYFPIFRTYAETTFGGEFEFEIPNYVIKILYFNYFVIELKNRNNLTMDRDIKTLLRDLALGDEKPFENQLEEIIKILSNRDHMGFDEKYFQVITLSLLSFAEFYFIDSQPEKNKKYPDILLIGRDDKVPNNYLIELKWIKGKDDYKAIKKEGTKQVEGYLKLDKIKNIPKLRSFLLIGSKDGVEFIECS